MTAGPYATSRVKQLADHVTSTTRNLSTTYRQSRLHDSFARTTAAIRHSAIYRWMTTEPEPEVVVIDLRETWTVGPILAGLDWLLDASATSHITTAGRTVSRSLLDAFRNAPIRAAGGLVLVAIVTNVLVGLALGSVVPQGLGLRAIVAALALLAVRVDTPLSELRNSAVGSFVRAVLEPPEPPQDDKTIE